MLHLSDIRKMERCPRCFWLSQRVKQEFIPYINYNESMKELVKERLMLKDPFEGQANDEGTLALEAFALGKPLMNARFVYQDLRISVPLLLKEEERVILYMTYKSCFPKEREAQKIADTLWVLKQNDIQVDEIYAIHLNAAYVRGEELDVKELLVISEYLYNSKNKAHKRIMDLVQEYARDVDALLITMRNLQEAEEVEAKRTANCTRGTKCPYYDMCFYETADHDSILHLVQSAHKFDMQEEGITSLKDVDIDRIEGTRHQYAQIMAAKQGGRYVDTGALRCWMKEHVTYPISYLDFEWETFAFPPYKGMKPYDVLTFQYSLHIEDEKGKNLRQFGFIGEKDCRKAFIKDLLCHIPKTGSILVYNMEGAEKLRLMQLAQQFPEYEQELKQIWERMVDLSLPFSTGNIYDLRMQGSYSLKTLVPIVSDYDYKDLAISYGMDAVEKWRQYSCCEDAEEKKRIYDQLIEYCAMDTYAEYLVYHALERLVDKECHNC